MLRPFDTLSQQCQEVLRHVEKGLTSFKLYLNIFSTFLLLEKIEDVRSGLFMITIEAFSDQNILSCIIGPIFKFHHC